MIICVQNHESFEEGYEKGPVESKVCTQCGEEKSFAEYHKMRRGKYGLSSWCKSCMSARRAQWRKDNREREKATNLAWRHANPDRVWETKLKSTYGISGTEYRSLLAEQDHRCAICSRIEPLVVDHDHICCAGIRSCGNCVRGLICRKCNLALGHFGDDVGRMFAAIDYVTKARA